RFIDYVFSRTFSWRFSNRGRTRLRLWGRRTLGLPIALALRVPTLLEARMMGLMIGRSLIISKNTRSVYLHIAPRFRCTSRGGSARDPLRLGLRCIAICLTDKLKQRRGMHLAH